MRYMLHLFSIAFSIFIVRVAFALSVIRFQPTAAESLALDRLVQPVAVIPAMRSRFRSFVDSARTHVDFTAGHFDPGRMVA